MQQQQTQNSFRTVGEQENGKSEERNDIFILHFGIKLFLFIIIQKNGRMEMVNAQYHRCK